MRQRPVPAPGDDRGKAHIFGPERSDSLLELERDVTLGAPHEPALEHPPQRVVGDRRGAPHRVDLGRLLDRAQPFDQPAHPDQRNPFGQQLAQSPVRPDGHVRFLEPQPDRPARQELLHHLEQVPLPAPSVEHRIDLLRRLLDIAKVRDERATTEANHRQTVRAGVAGQVPDVDKVRDQQRIDPRVGQQPDRPLCPAAHP